jgi:energy-coupling factor transporter ATP-binding protein EcfA2
VAITHDLELAGRAFERVIAMRDGSVVADGRPSEVLR